MRKDPLFIEDSDPNRPFRVLIVKLSSLGDVIHTLPVVADLHKYRDDIVVDWVVEPAFADLVAQCKGIRKIVHCNLRKWVRSPFSKETKSEWKAFVADLRSERYDAVFDLQGLSKSALVMGMAKVTIPGQRIAMANKTEGSSYERLTRLAADVAIRLEPHVHAMTRGRLLCAKSQNYEVPHALDYGLQRPSAATPVAPQVMLLQGSSRSDKAWPEAHWVELVQRLAAQGLGSVLVHGSDAEQATCQRIAQAAGPHASVQILPRMTLGALHQTMLTCTGVIGVDSGLSHLAVALDLPHVQIYNFDTAWRTGPVNTQRQVAVFSRPTPPVEAVWKAWQSVLSTVKPAAPAVA